MADAQLGALEYGDNTIIPAFPLDAPTTGEVTAGNVIAVPTQAAPLFFGVMGEKDKLDAEITPVGVNKHYRVLKKAATALAQFAYITFKIVAATDYYAAEEAGVGDVVYGQVMTAALAGDEGVHIHGPYYSSGNNYFTVV